MDDGSRIRDRRAGIYISAVLAGFLAIAALVLGVNLLVDPFWYAAGNQLHGENYPFNERVAKANRLIRTGGEQYNCLLLGSSTSTLVHEDAVDGYTCFNFSVSLGNIAEYVELAKFAKSQGVLPRLVIVGLDAHNFRTDFPLTVDLPDFLEEEAQPPHPISTYTSLQSLYLSLRTMMRDNPYRRFYDEHFEAQFRANAGQYQPPRSELHCDPFGTLPSIDVHRLGPFGRDLGPWITALRAVFPEATLIGYLPPVSPYYRVYQLEFGLLDAFTTAVHLSAMRFDRFYDLSLPSELTADLSRTYDGVHYAPEVHRKLIPYLLSDREGDAVARVDRISLGRYQLRVFGEVRDFAEEHRLLLRMDPRQERAQLAKIDCGAGLPSGAAGGRPS